MLLATVAEFEARLGEAAGSLAGEDLARAEAVLADASVIVLNAGDPTWTDAAGLKPAPEAAVVVMLRLARRMWDNPEGLSYEALGDHVTSRSAANSFLSADEHALLQQAAGFTPGVYSVRMTGAWS